MSKGLSGVKTLTAKQIADKWKLPLAVVAKKIEAGIKVEKEHTTSTRQANEIARDHLGERPDYYEKLHKMEKQPVVKEENVTGAVRGLGYVTGDPGVNYVDQYINTNAMSYEDLNGSILKMIRDKHNKHIKDMGFTSYSPNELYAQKNKVLNELGEYDNKGGTVDTVGLTDAPAISHKRQSVKEQGVGIKSYTEKPLVEKKPTPDAMPTGADRGIYEGWASIGNPYDRFGDVNRRAKFYGKKPKPTTTKSDEKDDTYKDSKQGGSKVKFAKPVKEAKLNELSPDTVSSYVTGAASQLASGELAGNRNKEQNRITGIQTGVRKLHPDMYPGGAKVPVNEVAMSMPPNVEAPVPGVRRQASASQQRLQGNTYRAGQSFASQGTTVKSGGARMGSNYGSMKPTTTDVKRNISNRFNPNFSQQATGSMKASSVKTGSSFSQGGGQVAQKMAKSSPSQVVSKMSDAGRQAAAVVSKAAPTAAKVAGTIARVAAGPAATAAAAVMSPTPAGEKKSEFQRQSDVAKGVSYKAQGRSISDYEKQVLTPKASETPKTPNPKVDAPTPPSRPDYFSRGQAFGAARGEAGGGSGKFSYDNKDYQTNVSGEPYKPSTQLKQTSVKEETKMDNKERINEALDCILENNLSEMKDNLLVALQEKAMEKLEERKKEIAANYFAE